MLGHIDRISALCGRIAAGLFFVIGLLIAYEVTARYVFTAPTPWTEEISRFLQIWATYLSAAFVLANRDMIVIDFFTGRMKPGPRRLCETVSLIVVAAFCFVAVVYGGAIVAESVAQNRHTATMLGVPRWMTEAAVPVGCCLLLAQTVVEILRLWRRGARS